MYVGVWKINNILLIYGIGYMQCTLEHICICSY